jgi:hypothetical protein
MSALSAISVPQFEQIIVVHTSRFYVRRRVSGNFIQQRLDEHFLIAGAI